MRRWAGGSTQQCLKLELLAQFVGYFRAVQTYAVLINRKWYMYLL